MILWGMIYFLLILCSLRQWISYIQFCHHFLISEREIIFSLPLLRYEDLFPIESSQEVLRDAVSGLDVKFQPTVVVIVVEGTTVEIILKWECWFAFAGFMPSVNIIRTAGWTALMLFDISDSRLSVLIKSSYVFQEILCSDIHCCVCRKGKMLGFNCWKF